MEPVHHDGVSRAKQFHLSELFTIHNVTSLGRAYTGNRESIDTCSGCFSFERTLGAKETLCRIGIIDGIG